MSEMKSKSGEKDWREIAEQAANETNSEKLSHIIEELCVALDHQHPSNRVHDHSPNQNQPTTHDPTSRMPGERTVSSSVPKAG